ncbi:MAG: hypothetical protein QF412_00460 [Planctomycetota bacterium]|nr:hypothetical protein [Planctomycetota bacterium]
MKWVMAGLSFAMMVGMAIAAAAISSANIRGRMMLQEISGDVLACRIEHARRVAQQVDVGRREQLKELWRMWSERASAQLAARSIAHRE